MATLRGSLMHGLSAPLAGWTPRAEQADSLGARLLRRAVGFIGSLQARRTSSGRAVAAAQSRCARIGHVALVGAGPGDAELLTTKAIKTLARAGVILHDQLVSDEVLALVPAGVERIGVGKKGYGKACKQGDINTLMVALALAGRRVVRLKAGDPLMFGRLEEEMAALAEAGIAFEVIPGISAAQGAAARLGVPLTRRKGARRFQAITGHAADGRLPDDFGWAGLADPKATTAVYMPKATIGDLCAELLCRGLPPSHPAAAVFNATRADEVVVRATIATLPAEIAAAGSDAPCIILIGDAVARARAAHQTSVCAEQARSSVGS